MKSGGEQRREVEGRRRGRRATGKEGDGGTISFPSSSLPRRIQRSHPAGAPSPSVGGSPGRRGSRCTGSQGHGAAGPVGAVARRRGGGIVVVVVVADAVARPSHLVSFSVSSLSSLCVDAGLCAFSEGTQRGRGRMRVPLTTGAECKRETFFRPCRTPTPASERDSGPLGRFRSPKGKQKLAPKTPNPSLSNLPKQRQLQ